MGQRAHCQDRVWEGCSVAAPHPLAHRPPPAAPRLLAPAAETQALAASSLSGLCWFTGLVPGDIRRHSTRDGLVHGQARCCPGCKLTNLAG